MDHFWVKSESSSSVPSDAVIGGHDIDDAIIYVGRAVHEGDNLPAKVIPSGNYTAVCAKGGEHVKTNYEILRGTNFRWYPWAGGLIPPNAVTTGRTATGDALFIGRGYCEGSLCVGKIVPSQQALFIPFGKEEQRLDTYEILTYFHQPSALDADQDQDELANCIEDKQQIITWGSRTGSSFIKKNGVLVDNNTSSYVGRAWHKGNLLPARVIADKKCAYVCYGEDEVEKRDFEVLLDGEYFWESADAGYIPPRAVEGGRTAQGEPLYIGRTFYFDCVTVGKVQQSHGCMYIAVGGKVVPVKSYEVLIYGDKSSDC